MKKKGARRKRKEREEDSRQGEREKRDPRRIAHAGCPYESGVIKTIRQESVVFFAARNEQLPLSRRLCARPRDGDTAKLVELQPVLRGVKVSAARGIRSSSRELVYPRINGALTPRRRQRGVKQRGIRVIGAAIMTRDAGKCYIEFKETKQEFISLREWLGLTRARYSLVALFVEERFARRPTSLETRLFFFHWRAVQCLPVNFTVFRILTSRTTRASFNSRADSSK